MRILAYAKLDRIVSGYQRNLHVIDLKANINLLKNVLKSFVYRLQ